MNKDSTIRHASLFSGIGGPEVAAAMLGWENSFHCEINPFGKSILEYWFPNSVSYEDITKTDFREWRGKIDVITGGFPCQPFSYAGKRGGSEDERYLWPQMLRAIDEVRPTWVVGENVAGLATMVEGGHFLTWEARQLFLERVTRFTDTCSEKPSPSNESAEILSVSDIPSSRFLFQLRLWGLPTEETESSSLPMLQTPTVVMTCEEPEKMRARAERNGYKNGTQFGSLESQIIYDERLRGMLLTPSATDGLRGQMTMDSLRRHNKKNAENSNLAEQIAHKIGGGTSRLSPLFTEEMMGFPLMWTTLPFLSQSGEPKALKPTEML